MLDMKPVNCHTTCEQNKMVQNNQQEEGEKKKKQPLLT
jgi:hypothetical protein